MHEAARVALDDGLKDEIALGLVDALEVVGYGDEALHLAVVLRLELLDRRPELNLVAEGELALDLGHVLVQRVQAQLVLILQYLVELTIPMS